MFLLNRRQVVAAGGAALGTAALAPAFGRSARAALAGHEVFTGDLRAAAVDSTLILGEEKALLIDAQFTKADAAALVETIVATGRDLETVFVTHIHPDHHLGLAIVKDRFPEARVVAAKPVADILAGGAAQAMLDGMVQAMGADRFADRVVIPEALNGEALTLEGERFDVIGPLQGDTGLTFIVRAPQLDAVVASDIVFDQTYLWTAEAPDVETIDKWRGSLDQIEAIGASVIVPGHRNAEPSSAAGALAFTRMGLDIWQDALLETNNGEDLEEAVVSKMGDLPLRFAVNRAVAKIYGGEN